MKDKVKIITSLSHDTDENDITNYIDKGIDEFYFGFMPPEWLKKYGWEICTNRRPYPITPHITDWKKAKKIVKSTHQKNKKIYLALNEHKYTLEQYSFIIPILNKLINFGIDGILIADIALINYLNDNGYTLPLHLSIGGGVFNNETIKFFHQLGIKRIILPRKLNPKEIRQMLDSSPKNMLFEIFLIGEWCRYNDAFCYNVHGYNKNEFCKLKEIIPEDETFFAHRFLREKLSYSWCGLCLLEELKHYLDKVIFKIPLRSDVFNDKLLLEEVLPLIKKLPLNKKVFKEYLKCGEKFCAYEFK